MRAYLCRREGVLPKMNCKHCNKQTSNKTFCNRECHALPGRKNQDKMKTEYLEINDYIVLRFTETEINNNIQGCLESIYQLQ